VALDLAAAAREMRAPQRAPTESLVCPTCGIELLAPDDDPEAPLVECPACETRFGVEEGRSFLHGGPRVDGNGTALD
jgi:DNA-directed RNA polymerase subunit RPC12/RpoP